ncbi:MAG TPA: hypothetical protein EYO33_28730, partial [Phycisphaerales bacterium]|nr:hypothetical protein [Phycisphaerales bacterium]
MNRDTKKRVPARTIVGLASAVVGMTALSAGNALAQTNYNEPTESTPAPEESIDLAQLAAMAGRGGGAPSGRSNDGLKS